MRDKQRKNYESQGSAMYVKLCMRQQKREVFLYEFCSKEVYSIHISLIPSGMLERVSIPLLAASDFPTFSLMWRRSLTQSTWI